MKDILLLFYYGLGRVQQQGASLRYLFISRYTFEACKKIIKFLSINIVSKLHIHLDKKCWCILETIAEAILIIHNKLKTAIYLQHFGFQSMASTVKKCNN